MKALKERFRALGPKQDASLGTITGERVEPLVRKIVARTNPLDPRRIVRTVKSGRVQYFELDAVSVCGDQVVLFEVKTTSSPSSVATGKKQLLRARGILLGTGIFKSVKLRLVIVDIAGVAQEGWPEVEIDALSEPTGCIRVPAADVERVAASSGISLPEGWASASARIFSEIFPTASAPERGEQVSTTVALALRRAGLSLPGGV
ncbi:MAG: hypothetical protein JST30_01505 [Armatimonadetes bacterium]|nr:hypothetical protein [Armatimonadota bacterium]